MEREEQLLKKRFIDQANSAQNRWSLVFTDFLNINEQSVLLSLKNELPKIKYFTYGGYDDAERKILCFCGDESISDIEDIDYPIVCVQLAPLNMRFSDKFTHRDFLGAVLNLGIDRSKTGDILVIDNIGYLFCIASISSFITGQLTRVKHTTISAKIIDNASFTYKPKLIQVAGTVSSIRLDSILSIAFKGSRSSLTGLIEGGKVFVNSRQILTNSYPIKENDVVSVRGMGRFIYTGTEGKSKKGRYQIKISIYSE